MRRVGVAMKVAFVKKTFVIFASRLILAGVFFHIEEIPDCGKRHLIKLPMIIQRGFNN